MIHESFDNWQKSPFTTTVEILPISQIRFPNVTVCPPKNSYFNLNHDIQQSENIKIDKDTRKDLFYYALDVFQDEFFKEMMRNLSIIKDPDRFYNWYHGYTKIQFTHSNSFNQLYYSVFTYATTGNISTQYFGENDKVNGNIRIQIYVNIPKSVKGNQNITLMFDINKKTMKEVHDILSEPGTGDGDLVADLTHWSKNITAPTSTHYIITLDRRVLADDLKNLDLDIMPGFRFTWNYTKHVKPIAKYSKNVLTKQFVRQIFLKRLVLLTSIFRLVIILDMTKVDQKNVWKIVRHIRKSFLLPNIDTTCQNVDPLLFDKYIKDNIDIVEEKLIVNATTTPNIDVTNETLQLAAELFTYLNYCPTKYFYVLLEIPHV